MMFEKSYYLEPDSKSPKAYVLLRRTLEDTDRTAIVQFALRQKTRLGALRVRDDVLVLQSLLWADEVREASFPGTRRAPSGSRRRNARCPPPWWSSMASDFEPDQFTDEYQEQLRQLIEAKLEKGEALDTEETFGRRPRRASGEVIDLMEALKRSIEKKRGGGGGSRGGSGTASDPGALRGRQDDGARRPPLRRPALRSPRLRPSPQPPRRQSSQDGFYQDCAASKTGGLQDGGRSKATARRRPGRVPEPGSRLAPSPTLIRSSAGRR